MLTWGAKYTATLGMSQITAIKEKNKAHTHTKTNTSMQKVVTNLSLVIVQGRDVYAPLAW